ncbi:MAG: response regulator [Thalassobaculum sp.]
MLHRNGHAVFLVHNGLEAVRAVEADDFDVVVVDVRMPVMSGIEAARHIRRLSGEKSQIPIVALTADVMDESRDACLDAGIDAFASKPIDPGALNEAIDSAVATRRLAPVA